MFIREHISAWDRSVIVRCNRINRRLLGDFFALISKLGDGWIWFAVMLLLPLIYGGSAISVSLIMVASSMVATALYKLIKNSTHRVRPCHDTPGLLVTVAPLDRYSFPSGHTLHAVCFTWIVCSCYPGWIWFLLPFTILTGLSRMVLGLHYFSDVLIGAIIGGLVGSIGILLGTLGA